MRATRNQKAHPAALETRASQLRRCGGSRVGEITRRVEVDAFAQSRSGTGLSHACHSFPLPYLPLGVHFVFQQSVCARDSLSPGLSKQISRAFCSLASISGAVDLLVRSGRDTHRSGDEMDSDDSSLDGFIVDGKDRSASTYESPIRTCSTLRPSAPFTRSLEPHSLSLPLQPARKIPRASTIGKCGVGISGVESGGGCRDGKATNATIPRRPGKPRRGNNALEERCHGAQAQGA